MNKKLFSAVLMGALLFGGTFVSCKDYDDDIENLQTQIDKLASSSELSAQVSSLQSQISAAQAAAEAKAAAASTVAEAAKKAAEAAATPADVAKAAQDAADKVAADLASAKSDLEAKAAAAQAAADEANAALTAVKNDMNATNGDVAKAQAAADKAQAAADAAAAKLAEVEAAVKGAQAAAEAAAAKADAAATPEEVAAAVKAASDELQAKIEANEAEIATLKAEIAKIQETLGQPVDDSAVKALAEQVAELAAKVAALTGEGEDVASVALASVATPATVVNVSLEEGRWAPSTATADKALMAKLAEKFTDIESFERNQLMKQGGHLPFIVNPAAVDLTKGYKFYLQGIDGKVNGATVSDPEKGLPNVVGTWDASSMKTKSSDDCFWNVKVELAKDRTGNYENISKEHALVIEGADGSSVKTTFSYKVTKSPITSPVTITASATNPEINYADEINVFGVKDINTNTALFTLANEMYGYYLVNVNDPADVERYKITTEGANLIIGQYPSNENNITIHDVQVIALGLNGSVVQLTTKVKVNKAIAANATLSAKEVTLATSNSYNVSNSNCLNNRILWNVDELGMTAVELQNFMAKTKTVKVYDYDANGDLEVIKTYPLYGFDANGAATTSYKDVAKIGFEFESADLVPKTYDIRVEAGTIFAAPTTLTVTNPTGTVISLYPQLVKDGVLQIVGDPTLETNKIVYNMNAGLKTSSVATIIDFADLDAETYNSTTSWINGTEGTDGVVYGNTLKVYQNGKQPTGEPSQLYNKRHFKVRYKLFDNASNVAEMEFDGEVVSEIYSEDPKSVITLNSSKLSAVFGGTNGANTIKLQDAITGGKYVAGSVIGQTYKLFGSGTTTGGTAAYKEVDYESPKTSGGYVLATDGVSFVEVTQQAYLTVLVATAGGSAYDPISTTKYYMTGAWWTNVVNTVKKYKTPNQYGDYVIDSLTMVMKNADGTIDLSQEKQATYDSDGIEVYKDGSNWVSFADANITKYDAEAGTAGWAIVKQSVAHKPTADETILMAVYEAYKSKIAFESTDVPATPGTPVDFKPADGKIKTIVFSWEDATTAAKFVQNNGSFATNGKIVAKNPANIDETIVGGKVELNVKVTITDIWGMKMEYKYITVTLKTN